MLTGVLLRPGRYRGEYLVLDTVETGHKKIQGSAKFIQTRIRVICYRFSRIRVAGLIKISKIRSFNSFYKDRVKNRNSPIKRIELDF